MSTIAATNLAKDPIAERDGQLTTAARQFESLFLQRLVSSMRESSSESLFPKGAGSGLYDQMMDQALAEHMSRGQGVGIADFLARQWTGKSLAAATGIAPASMMAPTSVPATERQSPSPDGLRDDGTRPLRELLPPDGLSDDFSLNGGTTRPEQPGEVDCQGESGHGHQVHASDHDGRQAQAIERALPGRAGAVAAAEYRQWGGVTGGHPGHAGADAERARRGARSA